jgi:uncharacterized repeat protein (TIGR03803 family)
LAASGDIIFGTTNGGTGHTGLVWSFDTQLGVFTELHQLSGTDGGGPLGGVAFDGQRLFGTASIGGTDGDGTIWSVDTTTGAFTKLHDFTQFTDGSQPRGALARNSGSLFGITENNGGNDVGSIWRFDTVTNTFTKLHAFGPFLQGALPTGGVTLEGDALFGTASGGTNGHGVIWQFDTNSSVYTKLHDFLSSTDGRSPEGAIVVDANFIYGTTELGGARNAGTIWKLDTDTGTFTTLHHFVGATAGRNPIGEIAFDGTILYGTAGPAIWSFDTSNNMYRVLYNFNFPESGGSPTGVTLSGRALYGTNVVGGAYGDGTLWSFVVPEPSTVGLLLAGSICLGALRR